MKGNERLEVGPTHNTYFILQEVAIDIFFLKKLTGTLGCLIESFFYFYCFFWLSWVKLCN